MIRFYLVPIEYGANGEVGPKYFNWRFDPDPPGIANYSMFRPYGLIEWGIVSAEVTQTEHDALALNSDVFAPPENIDNNVGAGAMDQVKTALETMYIPTDWVDTSYTYRQLLRMVAGLFMFANAHRAMHGEELITAQSQLDLAWSDIPLDKRQRIIATADSRGYDYSEVQPTWLVRRILKHLADKWALVPLDFNITVL